MAKGSVAVLMGGWSAEREVSLSTGQAVYEGLQSLGYDVRPIDVTENYAQWLPVLLSFEPDIVFNALHGTGGEDGSMQGLLNTLQIPYTYSGTAASAIAMDKALTRRMLSSYGILFPEWKVVRSEEILNNHFLDFPYVIKPVASGSSRGVFIIQNQEDWLEFKKKVWNHGPEVMVESYIRGREINVAVMGDYALGTVEIIPRCQFYNFEAKYVPGMSEHKIPAPICKEAEVKICELAKKAHNLLGCRGITRSDFIYVRDKEGEDVFYLLEINTQPGLTPTSLVPEIAAYRGIAFTELLEWMIAHAQCDA